MNLRTDKLPQAQGTDRLHHQQSRDPQMTYAQREQKIGAAPAVAKMGKHGAPPIYSPRPAHIAQPRFVSLPYNSGGPPVYRPDTAKALQAKSVASIAGHGAPGVYRPHQAFHSGLPLTRQPKANAMRPAAPLAYRPQIDPINRIQSNDIIQNGKLPLAQPVTQPKTLISQIARQPRPQATTPTSRPIHNPNTTQSLQGRLLPNVRCPVQPKIANFRQPAASVIQPVVPTVGAQFTQNGNYFMVPGKPGSLYSRISAAAPKPASLYAQKLDYTSPPPRQLVYEWTPNVRFLNRDELNGDDQAIELLKSEFRRQTGSEVPSVLILGKNDCSNFATALSSLIGVGATRQEVTTRGELAGLSADVGVMMKHHYPRDAGCEYHAATVVAKDGTDLVTLEAHVSRELMHPEFHIRRGVIGFVDDNSRIRDLGSHVTLQAAPPEPIQRMRAYMTMIKKQELSEEQILTVLRRGLVAIDAPTKRRWFRVIVYGILLLLIAFLIFRAGRRLLVGS